MRFVDLLLLEGFVGGAVEETIRDGFAVGRDLLAGWIGEEVEAFVGDEEGFLGFCEGGFDI